MRSILHGGRSLISLTKETALGFIVSRTGTRTRSPAYLCLSSCEAGYCLAEMAGLEPAQAKGPPRFQRGAIPLGDLSAKKRPLVLKQRPATHRCLAGGEGGIRTHGTRQGTTVFETARFNHSRTSPN